VVLLTLVAVEPELQEEAQFYLMLFLVDLVVVVGVDVEQPAKTDQLIQVVELEVQLCRQQQMEPMVVLEL
jgi:hypothetical protein